MSDRVVKIDCAIELASEFIGWSTHVANEHACSPLWQSLIRPHNRALLKIAASDFGTLTVEVLKPKPWSACWIDDALWRSAQVLADKRVDGASDVGRRCEEGGVNGAAAVEGRHSGVKRSGGEVDDAEVDAGKRCCAREERSRAEATRIGRAHLNAVSHRRGPRGRVRSNSVIL